MESKQVTVYHAEPLLLGVSCRHLHSLGSLAGDHKMGNAGSAVDEQTEILQKNWPQTVVDIHRL